MTLEAELKAILNFTDDKKHLTEVQFYQLVTRVYIGSEDTTQFVYALEQLEKYFGLQPAEWLGINESLWEIYGNSDKECAHHDNPSSLRKAQDAADKLASKFANFLLIDAPYKNCQWLIDLFPANLAETVRTIASLAPDALNKALYANIVTLVAAESATKASLLKVLALTHPGVATERVSGLDNEKLFALVEQGVTGLKQRSGLPNAAPDSATKRSVVLTLDGRNAFEGSLF